MDFEKIYNDAYLAAHIETENYIKTFLIAEENSINFFTENYRNITEKYNDEYKKDKFNQVELFTDLYVEFVRGRKKIKKDSINNAFKSKVLPLFEKKIEQITYSFERLIQEIAAFDAKIEAYRLFSTNYKLFEMIYESEDYSRFEIKDYSQVLEETDIYIYYDKIVYPYKYEPIKEQIDKNESNSLQKSTINESNYEKELAYKISILDEDEKLLILHSLYSVIDKYKHEKKTINRAEFLRTILICQGLTDSNIFQEKYTTKFYSNITKGLDYFTNTKYKRELVDSTLKKIKDFKIPDVEKYIKDLR